VREQLIQKTVEVLENRDFDILLYLHSCLDIAAQKKAFQMLIKILENIDGFRKEHADELKRLSAYLNSYPLLIGGTTKAERMQDDTIYDRYGISSITVKTLENSLEGAYPEKISSKGRMIANIDGSVLEEYRKKKDLTLDDLAEEIKLTKESIYLYEHERMRVKYEIAKRIEEFLHANLITPKSPFIAHEGQEPKPTTDLEKKLFLFDFEVYPFHKLDFDIGAKDKKDKLIVRQTPYGGMSNAIHFSNFFKTFLAVVSDEKGKDIPVIGKQEFMAVGSKKDLVRLIREKSAFNN
jgi:predicted transcriptional regulator